MAQISKKHLFTLDVSAWQGRAVDNVKVGNNRTISFDYNVITKQPELICRLHGYPVVTFTRLSSGGMEIVLNSCGFYTRTTQTAIKDFLNAMGIVGAVSFAKGEFTARVEGVDYEGPRGIIWIEIEGEREVA